MGLTEMQAAAARLSTEAEARRLLRVDPETFAREARLGPDELSVLQAQAAEYDKFARSLLHKRRQEAARSIPLTVSAFGEGWAETFALFASSMPVACDPSLDALAFLAWLSSRPMTASQLRAVARYEWCALDFRRHERRLRLGWFAFGAIRPGRLPGRCLVCWWRPFSGARPRYFQWPSC